jgi:lysophospholipid acyltransferase (LPLAT)-like uncharacterized protein
MQNDYHIAGEKAETKSSSPADRLARLAELVAAAHSHKQTTRNHAGRNSFTRLVDSAFAFVRKYLPPVHAAGSFLTAILFFVYARVAALTARIKSSGTSTWPNLPTPCVLALWHGDAPSLLVAIAKCRPAVPLAIMIAGDPRGDFLAMLCRMLGLKVVRGSDEHGGWTALARLSQMLTKDACVIITADGGGPARAAKAGAVALASAAGVPLVPLAADCHPAIQETRKWDSARNPVPFCSLTIVVGPAQRFDFFNDLASLEQARSSLEKTLDALIQRSARP